MREHVEQNVTDMPVGDLVEHLLRVANTGHQARATKKTQVMADERLRKLQALSATVIKLSEHTAAPWASALW